jgi:Domain of unknown function (DUF932)
MKQALSNEILRTMAPAIFADHAHEAVSDKYQFIPTIDIVEGMRREGWLPVKAQEQRCVKADRRGFQKHLIRFRQASDLATTETLAAQIARKAEFLEIVMTNSHDRGSAYQLHAGVFRPVCTNGMVVCDSTFNKISIMHMFCDPRAVIEASFKILAETPKLMADIELMKTKRLTTEQATAFAEGALIVKYDELKNAPIGPQMLLKARRQEDNQPDVWSTFNRVQENLIKGGQKDFTRRKENGKLFVRSHGVKAIDENIKLNKALWHMSKALAVAL